MARLVESVICGVAFACAGAAWAQGGAGKPSFDQPAPEKSPERAREPQANLPQGQLVDLRPKWERGQAIRYVMTQRARNQIRGLPTLQPDAPPTRPSKPGEPEPAIKQNLEQEITFTLTPTQTEAERGSTVELVYERVKLRLDTGGDQRNFDSADKKADTDDPIAAIVRGMAGRKQVIHFNPDGSIEKVEGEGPADLGAIINQLGLPGGAVGGGGASGGGGGGGGGGDWLSGIAGPPSGATLVRVGQTWTHRDRVSVGPMGPIEMDHTYTLRSASGGQATVFMTGRLASRTGDNRAGFTMNPSRLQGQFVWDTELGQLASMQNEMEFEFSAPGADAAAGMSIKSEQTVTVTRIRR